MELYFITGNKHKFFEAKKILPEIQQVVLDLVEIQSMDPKKIIAEKLKEAIKKHPGPLFCEDVSLFIESLNGFPGPLVKFWNNALTLEDRARSVVELYDNHNVKVVCTIGFFDGKKMKFFEGIVNGKIVMPRGESGFGFDPIVEIEGQNKTYAEIDVNTKNKISHRALALLELKKYLDSKN